MAHAAFCRECRAYVWVQPTGCCVAGHGPDCLSRHYDTTEGQDSPAFPTHVSAPLRVPATAPTGAPTHIENVVGRRAGAYIIDLGLLYAVAITISVMVGVVSGLAGINYESILPVLQLMIVAMFISYWVVSEAVFGATLGKLALGIRVTDLSGKKPSLGQSFVRNLLRFVDSLFFCLPGLLSIQNSRLHQRIGDRAAGTLVTRKGAADFGG